MVDLVSLKSLKGSRELMLLRLLIDIEALVVLVVDLEAGNGR
jgi:hypothetical protein